jgi:SAM-dependent methyltransferase
MIKSIFKKFSSQARKRRAALFRTRFELTENTRILDLGAEGGANIHAVLHGTKVRPENVYIADLAGRKVEEGKRRYGYVPVVVEESGPLPFPDAFFDIVFCSSVIEHVTVPKKRVWKEYSTQRFRAESLQNQKAFAAEIRRLGKQYFVQTPYRYFPIEAHSWLPFVAWLPRWLLLPVLRLAHFVWVTQPVPDWYLLDRRELAELFGKEARILEEKFLGLTKSLMAVKSAA